ncbi:hypothetical protein [Nonlabens sp.]|uniref:hypothetical protein n=1 Tax=Nonlabens sp. TaxID=1888209 RepID=UPI001BCC3106|nr:hypothetical protein [Nonlabens sp.]
MQIKPIIIAFLCSTAIISCSKDEVQELESITTKSGGSISKVSFSRYGLADMLYFPNMETFYQTQMDLEEQVENHDDAFVEQNNNLNEDDLIDEEESSGFDDEKPLTEFENSFSFYSLRVHLIQLEHIWLDQFGVNDSFDVSDSPYNHFIFDEEKRAVLNIDAQANIGEYLIQFTRFGYIQVPVYEMELFLDVVNDPSSTNTNWMENENVVVVGGYYGAPQNYANGTDDNNYDPVTLTEECFADIDNDGQIVYTDNRKVSWRHQLKGDYIVVKAKAKTRGFKHKRGKWRCRRLNIFAKVEGDISSTEAIDCDVYKYLDEPKGRKRRKVIAKDEEIHFAGYVIKYKAIEGITKSIHGWSTNRTDKIMLQ